MKLEIGESLIYSWLRHEKKCQIVQMNWKPSPEWFFSDNTRLYRFMANARKFYQKRGINIFPNFDTPEDFDQLIRQAEIDVLGLSFSRGKPKIYAVDVAFHRNGLDYKRNGKPNNVPKVIEKFLRATVCIRGYFNTPKAEIVFASPKVNKDLAELIKRVPELDKRVKNSFGSAFSVNFTANEKFGEEVIEKVQGVSEEVADTSELFLRSYQLLETCKKMS